MRPRSSPEVRSLRSRTASRRSGSCTRPEKPRARLLHVQTSAHEVQDVVLGAIASCQGCGAPALERVLDLGHHAPCDSLLTEELLREPEAHFPLVFCRCTVCGLAQIDYAPEPGVVFFREYPYRTAM